MSKKLNGGLGRGLDALLARPSAPELQGTELQGTKLQGSGSQSSGSQSSGSQSLRTDQIVQAGYQPRQTFEPGALAELAQSIRDKGVLQPLLVRPRGEGFEIVAGERRWRAAQLAGLDEVPVVIRDLGDREALEIAIVENLQREDLGPLEEAQAYQALLDQGLNQEGVAQAVGKGRSTVANALRLLALPPAALNALEGGDISAGHARAILAQPEGDRVWALEQIRAGGLSVREAEALRRGGGAANSAPRQTGGRPWRQHELHLSRSMGTRVRISGNDKGKIELSYGSQEELERLLNVLGGQDMV